MGRRATKQIPFENELCVEAINKYLPTDGYELRATGAVAGIPLYSVTKLNTGVKGTIKNIIFASRYKPDIVFRNALSNDIEIIGNQDNCLIYDEPVTSDGISWRKIVEWYENKDSCHKGKMNIANRFRKCLGSPIEQRFFEAYVEILNIYGDNIPALLPQVWLYYDPKLTNNRIRRIFEHQRMDFLMLFSESQRVVIELDGVQHYGNYILIDGRKYPDYIASPDKYAGMVAAQREMSLAGYDVYRFGGKELPTDKVAKKVVKSFFLELFSKYGFPYKQTTTMNRF